MSKYVLDTNIYIAAARDRVFGAELIEFVASFLPRIHLHAVVVQELVRGAISERARRQLKRDIIGPFEKRGRVIVPSYRAWKTSGEIVSQLVERSMLTAGGVPRSFMNDALLAASCREEGLTLITRNEHDFSRISTVEQISFQAPFPPP
ncbi:MAG: type II toxin-antitoxin system VapC family toxin [Gemmatimonadota bacterium]